VRKGQALLTLENADFRYSKEYLEVAEQIKYLKSEYERQKHCMTKKLLLKKIT
jgi:cobalt-zinc-cadmium efflux system membrane fusion protein